MKMWRTFAFALLFFYVPSCFVEAANDTWLEHAVIYQIYPISFKDSNNDGIGDLPGIISKLDFLEEMGVDGIWLSPIYASPLVDAGYDISDYYAIDERYGTMEDFEELVEEAGKRGIRIIMDFVPSYTSNQHEWFLLSENRTAGYENFYVWADGKEDGSPPNNWLSLFKYTAWNYSEIRQQWYFHHFTPEQPDLNYRDPGVVEKMNDVLRFWMDKGVSGFRVDAISQLFEDELLRDDPINEDCTTCKDTDYDHLIHTYSGDRIESVWMVYQWREVVNNYSLANNRDKMILMIEVYSDANYSMLFYGNETSEGATFPFNFWFISKLKEASTADYLASLVNDWLDYMPEGAIANWVLGNHDQQRVASRLGVGRIDGLNMLVQSLPGVAVTFMGEEIGMENGEVTWETGQDASACNGSPEEYPYVTRDYARTPYQWDNTTNAGFNEGATPYLPVSSKYLTCNLADQRTPADKRSHYHIYTSLVALRKNEPFVNGATYFQAVTNNTLVLIRALEGYDAYAVLFNWNENEDTVDLTQTFPNLSSHLEVVIASVNSTRNIGDHIHTNSITLDGYESLVVKEVPSTTNSAASTVLSSLVLLVSVMVAYLY